MRVSSPSSGWPALDGRVAVLVLLALAGACVSATLLSAHDGGWGTTTQGTSYLLQWCGSEKNLSAHCADVVASRFGSFDFYVGERRVVVPTSYLGLAYFMALAIGFGIAGLPGADARRLWLMILALLSSGFLASIFLLAQMAMVAPSWCPLCVIAHGLNAAIFGVTLDRWRRLDTSRQRSAHPATDAPEAAALIVHHGYRRRLAYTAAVIAILADAGAWMYYDAVTEARHQWRRRAGLKQVIDSLQADPRRMLREYYAQPVVDIPHAAPRFADSRVEENETLPRIVMFTDYNCSACVCFERQWRERLRAAFGRDYSIDVRQAPRIAPLSSSAQNTQRDPISDHGITASHAAVAARLRGGEAAFSAMQDLLFRHRHDRPGRNYADLARQCGLDSDQLRADMAGVEARRAVEVDLDLAQQLGVTTTPSLFLEGRRVPDFCLQSEAFWQAIGREVGGNRAVASMNP